MVPGFLTIEEVGAYREDVAKLRAEGRFKTAGVGETATNRVDNTVAQCEQCFIYPPQRHRGFGDDAARERLYATLDGVRDSLCQLTPLEPLLTEGLYVHYPNGYYRRHVDAAPNNPSELRAFIFPLQRRVGAGAWRLPADPHRRLRRGRADLGARVVRRRRAARRHARRVPLDTMAHEVLNTCGEAGGRWVVQPAGRRERLSADAHQGIGRRRAASGGGGVGGGDK